MTLAPLYRLVCAAAILIASGQAVAAPAPPPPPPPQSYAQLARLYLASPIVLRAQVKSEAKLSKKTLAAMEPLPPQQGRLMLGVEIQSVLKAPQALPAQMSFLWQGPLDANGKLPKLRKSSRLFFLMPTGPSVTLVEVGAAPLWSSADEETLRAIGREASDPVAVGLAPGALRLATVTPADGDRSSPFVHFLFETRGGSNLVAILERADGRWLLRTTTSDLDQDARPVPPNSLLWYHLACGLPAAPPDPVSRQASAEDAALAREAWAGMLADLGPCR